MAKKKNQHYVPVLYLKFFSSNNQGTQIGLFNLSNDLFLPKVGLRHQAKDDYFYGEDGIIEEALSKLEGLASPHLKQLLLTGIIPKQPSKEYFELLTFIIVLSHRTKDSAEQVKELTSKLANELMKYDDRIKHLAGKYEIYPTNPAAFALAAVSERLPLAFDLNIKLLINKTCQKFLTSDHPVVKYNQFLEQRKHPGGNVGLATKGLQLFFPISPTHMLILYDGWVYKIGERNQSIIELGNCDDVDKLNSLQILNCLDHIYFNEDVSELYLRRLYEKLKPQRDLDYSTMSKVHSYIDNEGMEHIQYHNKGNNLHLNLDVSFIKLTKKAKQYVLSDYVVQLRNEKLRGKLGNS